MHTRLKSTAGTGPMPEPAGPGQILSQTEISPTPGKPGLNFKLIPTKPETWSSHNANLLKYAIDIEVPNSHTYIDRSFVIMIN